VQLQFLSCKGVEQHCGQLPGSGTAAGITSGRLTQSAYSTHFSLACGWAHQTSGQSHTGGSVVFARWRHCAPPHLTHASLGPPKSTSKTSFWSVQPFLQGSQLWQNNRTCYSVRLHLQRT